uniref:CSON005797 protein n=1 Tax=Culicoides sonorensis TaxID=179676 RepID=A0A336LVJ1_CULSO
MQRQYNEALHGRAIREKIKVSRNSLSVHENEDVILKSQKYYVDELRKCIEKCPVPKMTKKMEMKILRSIPIRLKSKYPELISTYMNSIFHEFDTIMKAFSVHRIIKPSEHDFIPLKCDFAFKYKGKTENYSKYLRNREKINQNLFIFYPFIRFILKTSRMEFPEHLINFEINEEINESEFTLMNLKMKLLQEIQSNSLFIQKTWYPKICENIMKHYKKRTLNQKKWQNALTSAGVLVNQQLNEIKIRTIERLTKVIRDRRWMPLLKIRGKCIDNNLLFSPTLEEIFNVFEEVIDSILHVGKYLSPFYFYFDEKAHKVIGNPRWKIEIGEKFPIEAKTLLNQVISENFAPVFHYIKGFQDTFRDLYSIESKKNFKEFLKAPHQIDAFYEKIQELQAYLIKINQILSNEFFDTAIIYQSKIRSGLTNITNKLMTPSILKIFETHYDENIAICKEFETIKHKALMHPNSTEELIENEKYVLYLKNEYISELKARIQKSTNMMGNIVELRQLTPNEMSLQIKAISWLHQMKGIFDENAFIFEHYKSKFEEKLCINWLRKHDVWLDGPFEYIDPKYVSTTTETFQREFLRILKFYRNKIKADMISKSVCKWRGSLDDAEPKNYPTPIIICQYMIQHIKDFSTGAYMISVMCNPALKQRHWDEMSAIAGFDITPDAGTTIRKMQKMGLQYHMNDFEVVSMSANKELVLQENLKAMINEWENIKFTLNLFKDTDINILTKLDDIQCILDDHIVKTLSMRGSTFVKPCEEEVRNWYAKLTRMNKTLQHWGRVQSKWLYLLPIFSSKDIAMQMSEESRMFQQVTLIYKRYMLMVEKEPIVIQTTPTAGLLEAMESASTMLENIENGINKYLEKKRLFFPRFYFLSNEEMLEILAETKDPMRVQPHLKKCFEGINRLKFNTNLEILSIISKENEEVPLLNEISTASANGCVEKWLRNVQDEMILTISNQIKESFKMYNETERSNWVLNWPGMVILCVSQLYWAAHIHSCFNSSNPMLIQNFFEKSKIELKNIVTLIRSTEITNLQRITIKALIVIDVHAKDVVQELIEKQVNCDTDFNWLAQLRYYFESDTIIVKLITAAVKYAYEYLGNSDRLVITPLTDRCYRTLLSAYQLHLNGAPEGPAGTGKTETTKDLAKALAVQCIVFNCSESLDYKAMGKFFKGLASCGAWACFDEFNRIELEVLSVVAQQILQIIVAVRANKKKFTFEGTEIELNPACYVCITMNPGYAGRSELPDNLKVLFRTVAMMVPDYALIGEISLYSFGYINARNLSIKIVTTYRLCSEQLSSQNHYDYGMRAVKTVLQACGNLKKQYPNENEEILLLRSLLDVNLPKFLAFDIPLFNGIISDIFPNTQLPPINQKLFKDTFEAICKEMLLQPRESFFNKVKQTFEMMLVRHGFMLIGLPYSGKSSTLKVLAKIMKKLKALNINELYQEVEMAVLNPKSISIETLYGAFDTVTYEWTDGVISKIFRKFASDTSPNRKWIIFDGPVDAVWIENMNTVLDDNKKLCLTSGEVITMSADMSLIFEAMDLAQASPATVSRCGMIYFEPSTLGWETFTKAWLEKCHGKWINGYDEYLMELIRFCVPKSINFVRKLCLQLLYPGETKLLITTLSLMEMLLSNAFKLNPDEADKFFKSWIQAAMLFALVWGVGGILDKISRGKFDGYLKAMWKQEDKDNIFPEALDKVEISIPSDGLIFDYFYNFKQKGFWVNWHDSLRSHKINHNQSPLIVPTIETLRYIYILNMHIEHNSPMLLVGPTGTGKSVYIQNILLQLDTEKLLPSFLTFTTQTTANETQSLILSKLHKYHRGIYGPPKGKSCILFIDDMNMPAKELYGAQPPIELIRQYFDHQIWYDASDASPIKIHDILVLAACGLVGGSRQDVYARFLCHFNIFSINNFSHDTLNRIFSTVLLHSLRQAGHGADVITNCNQIVNATLETYKFVNDNLRPTPVKAHYIFNLRDITRVVIGCGLMKKENTSNKRIFSRLWMHEMMRVFYDCLIDDDDRSKVFAKLCDCIDKFFKEKIHDTFNEFIDNGAVTHSNVASKLFFGSYFDIDTDTDERKYEEIRDMNMFEQLAYKSLQEYNAVTRNKMDLVIFQYALMHLNRICRILTTPGGSALLIGVAGSGRQSLTRLAAKIFQQKLFQPEITKNYSLTDWHADLKILLKESGGMNRDTVFLLNERQLTHPAFLQNIDSLLNSGEVPNIYASDEKQEILELVKLAAQGGNRHLDISPLKIFQFFFNRTKSKLHIILCFSPIGSAFRKWTRLYPSLINCCTINWFDTWPEDALEMVAKNYIETIDLDQQLKISIVKACNLFHREAIAIKDEFYHNTGQITYITSASYIDFIKCYKNLLHVKQKEIRDNKLRYIVGLDKLEAAANAVSTMQRNLNELQPQLDIQAKMSQKMAIQIERETDEAATTKVLVKREEEVVNVKLKLSEDLRNECEKDLSLALPILKQAEKALNTLKQADIIEVKNFKTPPELVKLVMHAILILKEREPIKVKNTLTGKIELDVWTAAKKLLSETNFLQSLIEFDKDNISIEAINRIRKEFITDKNFKPKIIKKSSRACEGLCKWILAVNKYDEIAREVRPKKQKLKNAEMEYKATLEQLNEKRKMASTLDERLLDLNERLKQAIRKKQNIEAEVESCKNRIIKAESLLNGLGGEKSRWKLTSLKLQELYDNLPGDVLISCGIIAYLAPLTSYFRNKLSVSWFNYCNEIKIPCSQDFSLIKVLGSDITIQNWNLFGLPCDEFSIENAIIMQCSQKFSLFIDPQGQANKWIKQLERQNQLAITKFSHDDYMKKLEKCIEYGYVALIEGCSEEIETSIDVLLSRNTFLMGGKESISLGDNVIPFSPNFRLYLTTNLSNPHFVPDVYNKVTVINFALTQKGLEDQLLSIVVAKELPDLQEIRQKLVAESTKNKTELVETEKGILNILSDPNLDILEDENAIKILDNSKALAREIKLKQEKLVSTEIEIEKHRLSYISVARHCANLFYCLSDLPNVDPMYQFSLNWYENLFIYSIETAKHSKDLEKRMYHLNTTITYNLYKNVTRSLFERHKLLFSFILTTKVMIFEKRLNEEDLKFLITGGEKLQSTSKNPAPEWISIEMWNKIMQLQQLSIFEHFIEAFQGQLSSWKKYFDSPNPNLLDLPSPWNSKISFFHKIIILRAIRPDKVADAVRIFIEKSFGEEFVHPPTFNIAQSYIDSNALSPLIFILTPGADPMASLLAFAQKMGCNETFKTISLGQGQGPVAQKLIEIAQQEGLWVCLQNCHLASSWMPTLELLWENMNMHNTNPDFRLWLTSYPSDNFPTAILQNGIKMTNEPPTGLKQNLMRSYMTEPLNDPEFYNSCSRKEEAFTRLIFGICLFNGVVQERRKFGSLGWNISYDFNESDFQISILQLQSLLNTFDEIPFQTISYLTSECYYGGRVTDIWDRRLICTILQDYVNDQVVQNAAYTFPGTRITTLRHTEYRKVILLIEENMPLTENPEIYGLHQNAGIKKDINMSNDLIQSMMLTHNGKGNIHKVNSDANEQLSSIINDIESRLPNLFDVEMTSKKYPIDYNESMNIVLVQELGRFNVLLSEMKATCSDVQKAIKGLIVMTPELEDIGISILLKKIPTKWMKKSYPSLKPIASYMNDLAERIKFFQNWEMNGKPDNYWLSGFFFTQAFLTGVMQNYARKYKIPIDALTFDFEVLKVNRINHVPENGVYIYGLFIEGARWLLKEGYLEEQFPNILIETMPLIHFNPTLISALATIDRYTCPVYKTMERKGVLSTTGHSTNFILPVYLSTKLPVSHWIKRSVALVCQTSD